MTEHDRIDRARHLAQRAGFAEPPARVAAFAGTDHRDAVDALLSPSASIADAPAPGWTALPLLTFKAIRAGRGEDDARRAGRALNRAEKALIGNLRAWWLAALIRTDDPLGARMTLFWQNHFTSGHRKVRHAALLYRQQQTLARHALGSFRDLVAAVLTDPAMLLYLDARQNRRGRPNENLARELLELFTLGEGHYAESDVKELARALTGLGTDPDAGHAFVFRARVHDAGARTILGRTGAFDGIEEIVDAILAHPAAARLVAAKLWAHFVSPEPDPDTVEDWARGYRDSNHDTGALVRRILTSEAFLAPGHRGLLVKSPIEFVVGTHRALGLAPSEGATLVRACLSMQQAPYEPPNVAGWPGGTRWINTQTLLARERFVNGLLRDDAIDRAGIEGGLDDTALATALVTEPGLAGQLENGRLRRTAGAGGDTTFRTAGLLGSPLWHLA